MSSLLQPKEEPKEAVVKEEAPGPKFELPSLFDAVRVFFGVQLLPDFNDIFTPLLFSPTSVYVICFGYPLQSSVVVPGAVNVRYNLLIAAMISSLFSCLSLVRSAGCGRSCQGGIRVPANNVREV